MSIDWRPMHLSYDDVAQVADAFLEKHHPAGTAPVPIEEIVDSSTP